MKRPNYQEVEKVIRTYKEQLYKSMLAESKDLEDGVGLEAAAQNLVEIAALGQSSNSDERSIERKCALQAWKDHYMHKLRRKKSTIRQQFYIGQINGKWEAFLVTHKNKKQMGHLPAKNKYPLGPELIYEIGDIDGLYEFIKLWGDNAQQCADKLNTGSCFVDALEAE